jgi:hypothetical protein
LLPSSLRLLHLSHDAVDLGAEGGGIRQPLVGPPVSEDLQAQSAPPAFLTGQELVGLEKPTLVLVM